MKIKKIKEWVVSNKPQFIPMTLDKHGRIDMVERIKDHLIISKQLYDSSMPGIEFFSIAGFYSDRIHVEILIYYPDEFSPKFILIEANKIEFNDKRHITFIPIKKTKY